MIDDMDIDCGDILEGMSVEEKAARSFAKILAVASASTRRARSWAMAMRSSCPGRSGR
jgi:altronate hydrolase